MLMKEQILRHILTSMLLFLTLQAVGKRDSLLWAGIQKVGAAYQQGALDSALVSAQRLLPLAEQHDDALAQAQLHCLVGFCLNDQGHEQQAVQALTKTIHIGESHDFLTKATKARHDLYFTIMLPAYSILSTYYYNKRDFQRASNFAKKGMEWNVACHLPALRVGSISAFSEVLMARKDYQPIYEPMKQAVADAIRLKQTDFALQLTAYIVQIERLEFHRDTSDIPWIKAGRQLMTLAKTEHAKTLFLNAVNMTIEKEKESDIPAPTATPIQPSSPTPQPTSHQPSNIGHQSSITSPQAPVTKSQSSTLIVIALGVLLLLFICYLLWQRRQQKQKNQEAERQRKESYIEGMEQERSRLARELHDGVSNQLLAIEMKLNADGLTEQTMQLLNESREQVRRFSHELMPPEFEHATLDEILQDYAWKMDGTHSCHISYQSSPEDTDWSQLPHEKAYEIYRIVQEALTNALKHAKATEISVIMSLTGHHLEVSVCDKGSRNSLRSGDGIGLRTMRQRAESIGATLNYNPTEEGGYVVLTLENCWE